MKKFHLSFCLSLLIFSACSVSELSNVGLNRNALINENLPRMDNVKTLSDMSNIAFEWEPLYDNNIRGFYLYRSDDINGQFRLVGTIRDKFKTHYVDTKLEPDTQYYYMMRSFNDQGHISEDGKIIQARTMPRLESIPFTQAITNLPKRIKLIWRPHPDPRVAYYIIERARYDQKEFKEIARIENRLNAEFIDEGLQSNEHFNYRIIAVSFDGIKSQASAVLSSTSKALPPQVEHLNASFDELDKIILNWEHTQYEDFLYYKIYSTSSALLPYTLLAKTQENFYEDRVRGVQRTKYYKVSIVDKDGLESPLPRNGIEGRTLGLPLAPSIILAQSTSEGINLEWIDNDSRAVEYEVRRYGGDQDAIFKGIRQRTLRDIKALPGIEYIYEVISIDASGMRSQPSKKVKAAQ